MISGLSVVIPVYNEKDNVTPLIKEVADALSGLIPYEIVFVDDASTDGTRSQLKQHAAENNTVRIISHARNRGQSAAVVTGVRHAAYPWVATLDGDRQNHPNDLKQFIQAIEQSDHSNILCMGQRLKRQDNWLRRCSTKIANGVRRYFLKDNCLDSGCGIKIFPREVFLSLPLFRNCHRFLPALFSRAGSKIIYIPVSHRPRVAGVSKYGVMNRLWVGIVDLFGVAWLMRRFIEVDGCEDV